MYGATIALAIPLGILAYATGATPFVLGAAYCWSETMVASGGEAGPGTQLLGAGLGALGGFVPWAVYGTVAGGLGGYYGGSWTGAWDPARGMQWGGLVGGFAGDIRGVIALGLLSPDMLSVTGGWLTHV